jgi:hypothetical protein
MEVQISSPKIFLRPKVYICMLEVNIENKKIIGNLLQTSWTVILNINDLSKKKYWLEGSSIRKLLLSESFSFAFKLKTFWLESVFFYCCFYLWKLRPKSVDDFQRNCFQPKTFWLKDWEDNKQWLVFREAVKSNL